VQLDRADASIELRSSEHTRTYVVAPRGWVLFDNRHISEHVLVVRRAVPSRLALRETRPPPFSRLFHVYPEPVVAGDRFSREKLAPIKAVFTPA